MDIDVAVVVVSYNSAHVLGDLLDSLPAALGSLRSRTIVVDNGSKDSSAALVEGRDDACVLRSTNVGYAAAINRGVAALPTAKFILVLNPDVRLGRDSVRLMADASKCDNTGIVFPKLYDSDGSLSRSLRRKPTILNALGLRFTGVKALSEIVNDDDAYTFAHSVDWATGSVVLIKSDCFEQLGGWDETYFLYSEETDFCLRARDRGWISRFDPRATAVHIGGGSGQTAQTHSMMEINRVRLYARRHRLPHASLYFALVVFAELSRIVRGRRDSITGLRALLRPRTRPTEIGSATTLLPR